MYEEKSVKCHSCFGIILSNFYSGLAVVADDAQTNETQQETVVAESQPTDVPSQDAENDVKVLNFVFEEDFPSSVYYGQEMPDLKALRYEDGDSFLPKYYHLEFPDNKEPIPEEVYKAFYETEHYSLNYVTDMDNGSEGDTVYRIEVKPEEQEKEPVEVDGIKYSVNRDNTELNRTFTVMKYDPTDVKVSLNIDKAGNASLETNNDKILISTSSEKDGFTGTKIDVNINDNVSYYLKI